METARTIPVRLATITISALAISVMALATPVLTGACSSSTSGESGGGPASSQCTGANNGATSGVTTECAQCVSANCASALSSFQGGCGDYLSCVCPGGVEDPSLAQSCAPRLQETSCASASQAVSACVEANCAAPCSGGTPMPDAGGVDVASPDLGLPDGEPTTTVPVACDLSAKNGTCTRVTVPQSQKAALDQNCVVQGGMPASACPASGLIGCCAFFSQESCYYPAASGAGSAPSDCASSGGSWSTSP